MAVDGYGTVLKFDSGGGALAGGGGGTIGAVPRSNATSGGVSICCFESAAVSPPTGSGEVVLASVFTGWAGLVHESVGVSSFD